jgi:glycosyltransferase involved in cell wall biosynthesis
MLLSSDRESSLRVVVVGPALIARSGISTHLRQLFAFDLSNRVELLHFRSGGEGRAEAVAQKMLRYLSSPLFCVGMLIATRARVVHLNTSFNSKDFWRDVVYLFVAKVLKRRVVYQVHGSLLLAAMFRTGSLAQRFLRRILLTADVIVLLGARVAEYLAFAPDAHVRAIPNAVVPMEYHKRALATGPLRIVYIGRVTLAKGIMAVVEAVRLLRDRSVPVTLVVGGDGPQLAAARKAVNESQLEDRVRFTGPIHGEAKDELWRDSDLLVFPTYHTEGLPYALLESMAAGTVPIISAAGVMAEVVEHGVHGYIVPPRSPHALAERVAELHEDRATLLRLSSNSIARVGESYSIAAMSREFHSLYQQLGETRRAGAAIRTHRGLRS